MHHAHAAPPDSTPAVDVSEPASGPVSFATSAPDACDRPVRELEEVSDCKLKILTHTDVVDPRARDARIQPYDST